MVMVNPAQKLLQVLRGGRKYLLTTHDNPDPDALGSMVGLEYLIEKKFHKKATIAYAGIVGRAENRAMVKWCKIGLLRLESLNLDQFDRVCLVDTQFNATNHSLTREKTPTVVVDHHRRIGGPPRPAYQDVRPHYGATSTIVTEYLIDAGLDMEKRVATALFIGIKTDTHDLSRRAIPADVRAYGRLTFSVDRTALSEIENPPLSRRFFRVLHRAFETTKIYGHVVVSELGVVDTPDVVAEMADFFLKLSGVTWSVAMGFYRKTLYLSIRTVDDSMDAADVITRAAGERGSAGGHGLAAGGRIPAEKEQDLNVLVRITRARLLSAICPSGKSVRPSYLIPRS